MKNWVCSQCGHEVMATEQPHRIKWTDGHVCHFVWDYKYDKQKDS